MSNYYFIHLEGMDLSGKSSVAKAIQERSNLDWQINNNRLLDVNEVYDFINSTYELSLFDDEVYGYLYFVALMVDLKKFEQNTNVIQDSTLLLRSINYHTKHGNTKLVELFEDLINIHPVPTQSFYLTASVDARRKRLEERLRNDPNKVSNNDLLVLNDPDRFMEMDYDLMTLSQKYFNSTVIDTSNMTIEEVADYIINLCNLNDKNHNKQFVKKYEES